MDISVIMILITEAKKKQKLIKKELNFIYNYSYTACCRTFCQPPPVVIINGRKIPAEGQVVQLTLFLWGQFSLTIKLQLIK